MTCWVIFVRSTSSSCQVLTESEKKQMEIDQIFLESGFLDISIHPLNILTFYQTCRLTVSLSMSVLAPAGIFVKQEEILFMELNDG